MPNFQEVFNSLAASPRVGVELLAGSFVCACLAGETELFGKMAPDILGCTGSFMALTIAGMGIQAMRNSTTSRLR